MSVVETAQFRCARFMIEQHVLLYRAMFVPASSLPQFDLPVSHPAEETDDDVMAL
jgi:hypothetical protein